MILYYYQTLEYEFFKLTLCHLILYDIASNILLDGIVSFDKIRY